MNLRYYTLFFLFVFIICSVFSENDMNDNLEIAQIWRMKTKELLEGENPPLENLQEANSALDTAEEFQANHPDSFYLRAMIHLDGRLDEEGGSIRRAYELSIAALDSQKDYDGVLDVSFHDMASLYAALALRLKLYSDYLDRYERWTSAYKDDLSLLYAAARSCLYLGLDAQAIVLANRGEILSDNLGSQDVFVLNIEHPASAFRAISVVAGEQGLIESLPSVWRRWGMAMEDAIMPWILADMVDRNTMRRVRYLLSSEAKKRVNIMLKMDISPDIISVIKDDLTLARRLTRFYSMKEMIANYTGILNADDNYDGYVEEQIAVSKGLPEYRLIDLNQDRHYEWKITYSDGLPVQVCMDGSRLIVNYDEGAYPEISSIVNEDEKARGEAVFRVGAFRWEPSHEDVLSGELSPPNWRDKDIMPFVNRISVYAKSLNNKETGETITWLERGYPIKAVETRYSDSDENRALWVRELVFEDGVMIAGRRSFKPGIWELYERYENGVLVGIAWDPDMEGSPVYLRDWALDTHLQIQAWDLDRDGWMDVRRFFTEKRGESSKDLFVGEAWEQDLLPWSADTWQPWE